MAATVRGNPSPDPFSVWTWRGFSPGAGRKRMFARRAWNSPKFEHDDTSSHCPTPGANASRSYVFALAESGVARGEQQSPVRQAETLQHLLGVRREQLVLRGRILGRREAHELDLVELVHAEQAARVLARRARLAAEAGAERRKGEGKSRAVEDLVAEQVRDRHLGGRNREERVVAQRVHVLLELRQLAGAGHRVAIHEQRHLRLLVAELARVQVDAEVHERALQPRAAPAIDDESRTGDLGAAREVEQPERFARPPSAA